MNKKAILAIIITLGFAFSGLNHSFTYAEEVVDGTVNDTFTEVNTTSEPVTTTDAPVDDSTAVVTDSTGLIQCTGGEFRSYCSNEYNCYTNEAGEQICEYIPFSTEEYHCEDPDGDGQSTCEKIDLTENTIENVEENGTSGEGEVICADADEPGCEEVGEPELWPLILSLSALGFCIIFVIVINLASRKKR